MARGWFPLIRAFKGIKDGALVDIDVSDLIPVFLKKGSKIEHKYVAELVYKERGGNFRDFYFDASYGIVLHVDDQNDRSLRTPIACITFYRSGFGTVRIVQIQGPSYGKEKFRAQGLNALNKIKWERMLVELVRRWAIANGAMTLELISCVKSPWYETYRHANMFMRYDVTARRMGFRKKTFRKIYWMDLPKLKTAV